MTARRPLVLASGLLSELPPGDTVAGVSLGVVIAGSGLEGGGDLSAGSVTLDVNISPNPSGLIFTGDYLGIDGSALASGIAAQSSADTALASGIEGIAIGLTALASGNAALARTIIDTAVNLSGGVIGAVPYQSGVGATAFLSPGASGQVLTTQGASLIPTWSTPSAGLVYAVIADQKAQNTNGGTFTSGAWRTRDLNTEITDPNGIVSISSNQFTLVAGDYLVRWSAPADAVNTHQSRLYNVTDASVVSVGTSAYSVTGSYAVTTSDGAARVSIVSTKTFRIEHQCNLTTAGTGFGRAGNFATEQYTMVEIHKEV
jgi:hypothetical protein